MEWKGDYMIAGLHDYMIVDGIGDVRIIQKQNYFAETKLIPLIQENNELIAIFVAGTKTAVLSKKNQN